MKSTIAIAALLSTLASALSIDQLEALGSLQSISTADIKLLSQLRSEATQMVQVDETTVECDGYTFKFHKLARDWEDAERTCQADGGELASIHSQEESDMIFKLGQDNGVKDGRAGGLHIGIHDRMNMGEWCWSDGSEVDWENWKPKNGPAPSGQKKCAYMLYGDDDPQEWKQQQCVKERRAFVCKKPTQPKFVYNCEKVDQPTAVQRCEEQGMWLATLDNEADLLEARRVIAEARLNELDFDYTTQTWIGLTAKMDESTGERTWSWCEDGSFNGFTNWWDGCMFEEPEPNNNWRGYPVEMCTEMSLQGTWNDQLCWCDPECEAYPLCQEYPVERPYLCQSRP